MHDSPAGEGLPTPYKQIDINGYKNDENNYYTDDTHENMFLGCKDNETGEKMIMIFVRAVKAAILSIPASGGPGSV